MVPFAAAAAVPPSNRSGNVSLNQSMRPNATSSAEAAALQQIRGAWARKISVAETGAHARKGRHYALVGKIGLVGSSMSSSSARSGHDHAKQAGSALSLEMAGAVVAIAAAICNGSFSVPLKVARKRYPSLSDPVFQSYWAVGVGFVSLATIPLQSMIFDGSGFEFAPMGIVSGLFSALATVCVLVAVQHLGVGLPPSLYAASFILMGVLEDLLILGETVGKPGLLMLSLCLVSVAAAGIAFSKLLGDDSLKRVPDSAASSTQAAAPPRKFSLGLLAAFMVGVFGSFVPLTSKMAGQSPFAYVASFGIGLMLVHFVLVPILMLVTYGTSWPSKDEVALVGVGPYGFASGVLWGLGNAGLNFALTAGTRFDLAISIYQCGLFVSGVWGIFAFGEIAGDWAIALFFSSAGLLFGSIALEGVAMA